MFGFLLVVIHGFANVVAWICQCCYVDFLKLIHGLSKVILCLAFIAFGIVSSEFSKRK